MRQLMGLWVRDALVVEQSTTRMNSSQSTACSSWLGGLEWFLGLSVSKESPFSLPGSAVCPPLPRLLAVVSSSTLTPRGCSGGLQPPRSPCRGLGAAAVEKLRAEAMMAEPPSAEMLEEYARRKDDMLQVQG